MNVQENQDAMELNGTHTAPVYADDVNALDEDIDAMKENVKTSVRC
jgi:hypothetical protein